jgi:hypothetical protein
MLVVFVQPWVVWEENHPSFYLLQATTTCSVFQNIYLLPTSLILDRIELYICVSCFFGSLNWLTRNTKSNSSVKWTLNADERVHYSTCFYNLNIRFYFVFYPLPTIFERKKEHF